MKRNISPILFVILFMATLSMAQDKNFIFTPEKPKPGDVLTLQFDPISTELNGKEVALIIYSVKNSILNAEEYLTKREGNLWLYKYQIPDTSQALGIKFIAAGSNFTDQVAQKTFPIQLFDKSEKLLKGSKAASAYIVGYQGVVNDKADLKSAYKLYKEEFTENPSLTKYYIWQYCDLINTQEEKKGSSLVKKVLAEIEKSKGSLDEKQLTELLNVYKSYLNDENKAKKYNDLILKKYSTGTLAEREVADEFYKDKSDPKKKEELLDNFIKKFPKHQGYEDVVTRMTSSILVEYCRQGKLDEAKEYLKKMNVEFDDETWIWQYSSFAQAANICLAKGEDITFTEQLNDISLKLARMLMASHKPNPNWLTQNQYQMMTKEFASGSSFVTAVKVYEKTKGVKEAQKIAEEGYKLSPFSKELRRLYAKLLIENNRAEDGIKLIDDMFSERNVPEDILTAHKSAYIKIKGSEEGYEKYLSDLKEKFLTKFHEKVRSSITKKEAHAFTLTDLAGKKVSLSDYKGKIVILDFWATWCGPCKASFPLMQKAQEKYSSDPNIKFLFVNTMEQSGLPGENASKYIKQNNYPFHVVIDSDSKISAAFGVSVIPTKIFIDKEGNIRYTAVGFEAEILLEEIDIVINLIK